VWTHFLYYKFKGQEHKIVLFFSLCPEITTVFDYLFSAERVQSFFILIEKDRLPSFSVLKSQESTKDSCLDGLEKPDLSLITGLNSRSWLLFGISGYFNLLLKGSTSCVHETSSDDSPFCSCESFNQVKSGTK